MTTMMVFALAIMAAAPQSHQASAMAQATVTIRVVSGVRLKLDGSDNPGAPRAHEVQVRSPDGSEQTAKLIEFE